MCLICIALKAHPDYPLIIAANRDEFYARPTHHAHYWNEHSQLLAGKDLLARGTWLGITRSGRFAAITNYRDCDNRTYHKSRGDIVRDFLTDNATNKEGKQNYMEQLHHSRSDYAGYNCFYGNLSIEPELHYYANHTQQPSRLTPGIHGLSNASLDTPWLKVTEGKKNIESLIKQPFNEEAWLNMLADEEKAAPEQLPDTGIDKETEHLLSSRFIQSDDYGTRSSTLITVSQNNDVKFIERNFSQNGKAEETRLFQFQLHHSNS